MDILYIVGNGSIWQNNELRYSLRSIEQNGINVGRVFVCGFIPEWINRETVVCLPLQDKTKCKHWNICAAILYAAQRTDIGGESGDFLYSSDDHFYLRPTDFAQYPYFCKGELPDSVDPNDKNKEYHTTLANTHHLLAKYGYDTRMYNWHGNTHFNRHLLNSAELFALFCEGATMPEGVEPTSLMLNYQHSLQNFDVEFRNDSKLAQNCTEQDVELCAQERECVSSVPMIAYSGLHDYLYNHFRNKSKYEK